jgi:zinc protease
MGLDRTLAPNFIEIDSISIQEALHTQLDNQIDVHYLNAGSQDLIKVELIFPAGMYHQQRSLVASSANNMLVEGTNHKSADQLADAIDYFGAFFEHEALQDSANVTLYTLKKYLPETLPLFHEAIAESIIPQKEFETFINNKKQKHFINNEKVNIIARRQFAALIFGTHPYGTTIQDKDFDTLTLNEVKHFYSYHYQLAKPTMVLSGKVSNDDINLMNHYFGKRVFNQTASEQTFQIISNIQRQHFINKNNAIQSAIRIGRILFNKTHQDYFGMQVLNCLLGGYFGSRLMANIREDKGYTYGIGSGIVSLKHAGYFYISTEVGVDVTKATLKEIYHEIHLLRNELVSEEELQTVKNYMLGNILRSIDGPFALAEKFKSVYEYGLDYSYYQKYVFAIKNISSEEIRDLAIKYLNPDDLIELVVGKQ